MQLSYSPRYEFYQMFLLYKSFTLLTWALAESAEAEEASQALSKVTVKKGRPAQHNHSEQISLSQLEVESLCTECLEKRRLKETLLLS